MLFYTTISSLVSQKPRLWSRRHPCEGHRGLQKNAPEAVELFYQSLYQGLRLISWLHIPSSLQNVFSSFPPVLNFAEALLLRGLLPSSLMRLWRMQRVPGHTCGSRCRAGAAKQLHPVLWSWRAEPRRGWPPLQHTDVGSNQCCLSTEAASFSHGGERKPEIWTVTRRLAHCYGLGRGHIYNSCCDVVLSV